MQVLCPAPAHIIPRYRADQLSKLLRRAAQWRPWKKPAPTTSVGAGVEADLGTGFSAPGCLPFLEPQNPPRPVSRPEVLPVVEVPGGGVAHHLTPVVWFLQHGLCPKLRRHGQEPQGGEEFLCHPEHVCSIPALAVECRHRSGAGCPGQPLTQVSSLPKKGISDLWPPFPEVGPLITIVDKQSGLLTPHQWGPGEGLASQRT